MNFKLRVFDFVLIIFIGILFIISSYQKANITNKLKSNHKVVLSQIEKQINTQTKYIKLLEEVLKGEG